MSNSLKVVWYNGMSIDKVHFEQQERYFERNINLKSIGLNSNFYGIVNFDISTELLEQGKIGFNYISAIAQDGTIYDAPNQDELPTPFEANFASLRSSIIALKISLNNPVSDISLNNDIKNSKFKAMRINVGSKVLQNKNVDELSEFDDDDFQDGIDQDHKSIIVAGLKASLAVLGDKTPYEIEIPLCKISDVSSSGQIKLDDKFIPTCLDISSHGFIKQFLAEILYSIRQHKDILSDVFKGIDQTKNTLDFSTYLAVGLLKKYDLLFSFLQNKGKIHPEFLYEKLIEFQAELAALSLDDSFTEFVKYDHMNLTQTFLVLINNIRLLFSKILSPKYTMAKITQNSNGFYNCVFDNDTIVWEKELYLAISCDEGSEFLMKNFKTQCKIHSHAQIKNIVASQLNGINMQQISLIPTSLPSLNGYVYYKIDKNDENFISAFKGENTISIYLTNNIKNPDIKLWALL
ncbi:MAG: type VI secretion system baseplate subunit TssK [Campylobacter sp.]|nr:type VI secretion system baseplate subunit TssK [Campylobacter sp.]